MAFFGATSCLVATPVNAQERLDTVVVTGRSGGGAASYTYATDPKNYDPFAAPTGGGGNATLAAIGKAIKDAADKYVPACGDGSQAQVAAQITACAANAVAQGSAQFGIAFSAFMVMEANTHCKVSVAEKMATGGCN